MNSICVYCGSSFGNQPAFAKAARQLANAMNERSISLVYGGASVGIMGEIANAVLAGGGAAIGVIPQALADKEVSHTGLTELHIVSSMHERKALMAEISDGFIALPGGFGTLEELFEMLTWSQLGFHQKPVGLVNVANYYDGLLNFLDHTTTARFVKPAHRNLLISDHSPEAVLDRMQKFQPSMATKWIGDGKT